MLPRSYRPLWTSPARLWATATTDPITLDIGLDVRATLLRAVTTAAAHGPAMPLDQAVDLALQMVVEGPVANASAARYSHLWVAFRRYCLQTAILTVADVRPEVVETWVRTLTRRRLPPSASTQILRRTAIRHLFAVLRSVGITDVDPSIDLSLPTRGTLEARALTEAEIGRARLAAFATTVETRQPALLALAEAGATTSEIPKVTGRDLDLDNSQVQIRGHTKTDARKASLSDWGVQQLLRRARVTGALDDSLVYEGAGPIESAQASASATLRSILQRSGVANDPAVAIKSFRVTYGVVVLARTGRIDAAARALGMRSLDQAAELLGFVWKTEAE